MYDIEHIYLFDPKTMKLVLNKNGFDVIKVKNIWNSYSLDYIVKMFPFPHSISCWILNKLQNSDMQFFKIPLSAGNMVSLAQRPV
jgi:hypothetical protein